MTDLNAPPLLVVTRSGESLERVLALELGADDYVVKPAKQQELNARLLSAARRAKWG